MNAALISIKEKIQTNIIIPVTACFILGAIISGSLDPNKSQLACGTIFTTILFIGLFAYRNRKNVLLYSLPLFFLLGILHTGRALLLPADPDHVYNLINRKSSVTLTGSIISMPEFDGHVTRIIIDVDSIQLNEKENSEFKPARGRIKVSLDGSLPKKLSPGDLIVAIATLYRPVNYMTPGVFDYQLYLADRSIYVTGKIKSPEAIVPFKDLNAHWYRKILFYPERVRYRISLFLDSKINPKEAGLYKALLIGNRSSIAPEVLENFKATGCMHILAISGLHMGLLGLICFLILSWVLKRSTYILNRFHVPTLATLLSLPILFGYAFVAGMNTPVLRALIMSVFFLLGVVLRRQRSILHIVAAAAFLLLILKPLSVFTASFQLSFSSVLAIAIIYPRLIAFYEKKKDSIRSRVFAFTLSAFAVSIAATLGSLPFMLLHFNRISLIGPIINLLVEPLLCFWSLPLGLTALPFIPVSPELATLILKLGTWGINAAEKITGTGASVPIASIWSITPLLPEILIYYSALLIWFCSKKGSLNKKTALVVSVIFVLYFTRGLWGTLSGNISEISFLDIGQGSSTVIKLPAGRTILLDGGNNSSQNFNAGERIIAPFLWQKQFWRIDDVIISHPHSDHYNGLDFILTHFHPKRLWINGHEGDSESYNKLLQLASQKEIQIIEPNHTKLEFSNGPAVIKEVLNSSLYKITKNIGSTFPVNDLSMVIKLQHGKHAFLFPGDISTKIEKLLIDNGVDLKANILLAPHHGSIGSGSKEFLAVVDPEIIVISAGEGRINKYPSTERLDQWRQDGRSVFVTSQIGTVTYTTDGSHLQVKTFKGLPGSH